MFHTRVWGPEGETYRAVCAEEYGTYMDTNSAAKFGVWSEAISAKEAEGGPATPLEGASYWDRALTTVEIKHLYDYGSGVFYDMTIASHLLNFTDTPFTAKAVPVPINIEMKWTWL
jgi:hypothetical protein